MMLEKLPPIVEDACRVFSNMFDLYTTTVFRVCAGSSNQERILLGLEAPQNHVLIEPMTRALVGTSSPLFGFGRQSPSLQKPTNPAPTPSACTDAEFFVPLPSEMDGLVPSINGIRHVQESLKGITKLDLVDGWVTYPVPASTQSLAGLGGKSARILEKRQSASWSCVFLPITLQIASLQAKKHSDRSYGTSLDMLDKYVQSIL
jgi:hypothetical protein